MFDHQRVLFEHGYKDRHNELLREAEMMRLINQADRSRDSQSHLYTKVLGSVGHRLVSLGQRLEQLDNNRKAILTLEKSDCSD